MAAFDWDSVDREVHELMTMVVEGKVDESTFRGKIEQLALDKTEELGDASYKIQLKNLSSLTLEQKFEFLLKAICRVNASVAVTGHLEGIIEQFE